MIDRFANKVFHGDARKLVLALPTASMDSIITDPMYGVNKIPKSSFDWGPDPVRGDPNEWWAYHGPIYEQCRRVLKPGGTLALAMGSKFWHHFPQWFGGFRIWSFFRFFLRGLYAFGHIWIVQTKEQRPIPFPDKDSLIFLNTKPQLLKLHPCPKAVEEMEFLVTALTKPDDLILDCFCGIGTTLVAAKQLGRRWIGCDLSKRYCQVALQRLAEIKPGQESLGA